MYICNVCKQSFSSKGNLKSHEDKAKYCKKIKDDNTYQNIILESNIKNLEYKNKELQNKVNDLLYTLDIERIAFQDKLNEITLKLIEKNNTINNYSNNSTNNTTNNTKIDIFNTLTPLTDEDYSNNINNLTIEHVKQGAIGFAKYSLEFPLKDKLLCLDYSRKKICYKDGNGNKIEDTKLNKVCTKLFQTIDDRNTHLLNNLANDTFNKMNVLYEETSSFDGDSIEEKDFNYKSDHYQELIDKYHDILSDCRKTSRGEPNKLYTEIVNTILDIIKN